jgi:hypothetical protein
VPWGLQFFYKKRKYYKNLLLEKKFFPNLLELEEIYFLFFFPNLLELEEIYFLFFFPNLLELEEIYFLFFFPNLLELEENYSNLSILLNYFSLLLCKFSCNWKKIFPLYIFHIMSKIFQLNYDFII